jgi:hypothetical protein
LRKSRVAKWPWQLTVLRSGVLFLHPVYGTCFTLAFWCLEFWGGLSFSGKYLDTSSHQCDVTITAFTINLFKAYWLCAPAGLTLKNYTRTLCPRCIYVFCIYLRTTSNLCHLQHKLIGFYNRDEKCLQRGTDWVFK